MTNCKTEEQAQWVPQGIIISCQAPEGSPLRDPYIMAALARAAEKAGAVGIRAEGVDDISRIAESVSLPIIGIRKKVYPDSEVYITPTKAEVDLISHAGAKIIALDATPRPRPGGETLAEVVSYAKSLGLAVMADLSSSDDAAGAVAAGVDILGTTLVPVSDEDIRPGGPNLAVIEQLANAYPDRQIIAEGRFSTPADAKAAFQAGASTVVIGKAVTDAYALTYDLVTASNPAVAFRTMD